MKEGRIHFSKGSYVVDEIMLPSTGAVSITGEGTSATILIPAHANQRVIRGPSIGSYENGFIGDFTLRSHSSGSTGEAMLIENVRNSVFSNIAVSSSGTGSFTTGIVLKGRTYSNDLRRLSLSAQAVSPKVFIAFENNGSALSNANNNRISDVWIYANPGLQLGIDGTLTANLTITGGLIEENRSAVAIRPGTGTDISGVWFESNSQPLELVARPGQGNANAVIVHSNYFSGGLVNVPDTSSDCVFRDNPGLTVIDHGMNTAIWQGRSLTVGSARFSFDGEGNITVNSPKGSHLLVGAPAAK